MIKNFEVERIVERVVEVPQLKEVQVPVERVYERIVPVPKRDTVQIPVEGREVLAGFECMGVPTIVPQRSRLSFVLLQRVGLHPSGAEDPREDCPHPGFFLSEGFGPVETFVRGWWVWPRLEAPF